LLLGGVVLLAWIALPGAAIADTHTVTFDDLSVGTTVTNQYADAGGAGEGVTFGLDNNGSAAGIVPTVETQDQNPNHVGVVCQCGGEFHTVDLWGSFNEPKHHVSLDVGALTLPLSNSVSLTLMGLDKNGVPIGGPCGSTSACTTATVTPGAPFQTMQISDPSGGIAFFELLPVPHVDAPPLVAVDNVTYDVRPAGTPAPPPAFGIHWTGPAYKGYTDFGTTIGNSVSTTVAVTRLRGSTGALQYSASGYPSGVHVTFSPPSPTASSPVTVTFQADPNAASADHQPVTITATPVNAAASGPGPQTATIPLTILGTYSVLLRGMEVVQAVQTVNPPTTDVPPGTAAGDANTAQLSSRDPLNPGAPVQYAGVGLAAGGTTVARVWGSVASPSDLTLHGVMVELHGYAGGIELPGSPLVSDPMTLGPDTRPFVNRNDLANPNGAWDLTLPNLWTTLPAIEGRALTLKATVIVPQFFSAITQEQCATPLCAAYDTFTLGGIAFTGTNPIDMTAVGLTYLGDVLKSPGDVFAAAESVIPTYDGGLVYDRSSYSGTIDVSDIRSTWVQCKAVAKKITNSTDRVAAYHNCDDNSNDGALSAVEDWKDNHNHDRVTIGVGSGTPNQMMRGVTEGSIGHLIFPDPIAVVSQASPLKSVAHELFHALGRDHASPGCGGGDNGQVSQDWPPDEQGLLQSIGFDRSWSDPMIRPNLGIFGTIAAGAPGPVYDFMSYCAGDTNSWVSARGWNETLQYLHNHSGADAEDVSAASAGPALRVLGFGNRSGVQITHVTPVLGGPSASPALGPPDSSFRLVVRNSAGGTIANAPMQAIGAHNDGTGTPVVLLSATIPVPGAATAAGVPHSAAGPVPASVTILDQGQPVAQRKRSLHVPSVRVISPAGGATVGRGRVVAVVFRAHHAGSGVLSAKVDYSFDDGHTYNTLWIGPARGRVLLPSVLLSASRQARIRVRVSDGFNEGRATSGRFTAIGSPPSVLITRPAGGARVSADGALELAGFGTDDRGRQIASHALRWFAGRKFAGRGTHLHLAGFAPGRLVLRLLATARGRTGQARVVVTVSPAVPRLLSLRTPRSIRSSATSIVISIATTVRAKLQVGRHRYSVSRTKRRLRIAVARGSGQLVLAMRLTAGTRRSRVEIVIPRR
jgi:hypothetical protein